MSEKKDPGLFDTDDAALIIGRQIIEIFVLRRGLEDLRSEQVELRKVLESMKEPPSAPTVLVVERAEDRGTEDPDASGAGQT